jgi:hypothetical protein
VLLSVDWFRTELVVAHARAFFPNSGSLPRFGVPRSSIEATDGTDNGGVLGFGDDDDSTKRFLSYVLLDFAAIDPDLMPASIVETGVVAKMFGFGSVYESTVNAELGWKKKDLVAIFAEVSARSRVDGRADAVINQAAVVSNESVRPSKPGDSADLTNSVDSIDSGGLNDTEGSVR